MVFMKKKEIIICSSIIMSCLLLIYFYYENTTLQITNYSISSSKIPNEFNDNPKNKKSIKTNIVNNTL